MNPLHPKKLRLTKWTAVQPVAKQKHFLVVSVVEPDPPATAVEWVELEAIHSRAVQRIVCSKSTISNSEAFFLGESTGGCGGAL